MAKKLETTEEILGRLDYNSSTGIFLWTNSFRVYNGKKAGFVRPCCVAWIESYYD